MRQSIKLLALVPVLLIPFSLGCAESKKVEGPEEGSLQAYLDANPDVAAEEENEGDDESAEFDAGS